MIGELVKYPAPAGLSREEIIKDAQGVVSRWQAEPQLIRKHFLWTTRNGFPVSIYGIPGKPPNRPTTLNGERP